MSVIVSTVSPNSFYTLGTRSIFPLSFPHRQSPDPLTVITLAGTTVNDGQSSCSLAGNASEPVAVEAIEVLEPHFRRQHR
ncbi:hypothetical protein LCGC14_1708280 [marine sediment metagenome]|uniref:Uncharacterized protein n=1 Tax=marine sediment metagenome TaxID=412755 RepID=A0A0F9I3K1_9ZZZZ